MDKVPMPVAATMLGSAILAIPVLGWWPLVGIVAAVGAAAVVVRKF